MALITGSIRGIGLEIARSLVAEGFHLALNGLSEKQEIEHILGEFGNGGIKVNYIQDDSSKRTSSDRILQEVEKTCLQLNVLVNKAGIAPESRQNILKCTEESFNNILNVNLKGSIFLSQ